MSSKKAVPTRGNYGYGVENLEAMKVYRDVKQEIDMLLSMLDRC